MNEVQVKKRDGTTEAWNFDKLVVSIGKAGVPMDAAEKVAVKIQDWAKAAGGTVDSNQIRDKVVEELKAEYPTEATSYQAYKKE